MSKKRQVLLNRVIEEYLKSGQPIGSQSLKISANIKMSSATIRNHFKVMMEEGLLAQTHISSGRIPTSYAFKNYWREQIDLHQSYEFPSFAFLEKKSAEIGCFVGVFYPSYLKLLKVEIVHQSFLCLSFGEEYEVILRYSQPLKRFLDDLVGMTLEDIQSFCLQVHAMDVFRSLSALAGDQYRFCGARYLASFMQTSRGERLFFDFCSGEIFKRLGHGIYFDETLPKNYLALIFDAVVEGRNAQVVYCGELDKNYSIL
ncbi:hypothetical protein [Helicobacter kayseriensis]|uniref:hypothetical protein n=1 Tax=Helicobacter kayseriensis TaxID=2905877 RepID=UPI001E3B9228|nr:hypothetical protein [Helicobacter kayseriensis]MCE3047513.1 hypothetical protein [Helicobacter kayseriensis]MCE3048835.1 hypothetical protein [Helicobacter kayseriensis]